MRDRVMDLGLGHYLVEKLPGEPQEPALLRLENRAEIVHYAIGTLAFDSGSRPREARQTRGSR
jgi:hypothetical protein